MRVLKISLHCLFGMFFPLFVGTALVLFSDPSIGDKGFFGDASSTMFISGFVSGWFTLLLGPK